MKKKSSYGMNEVRRTKEIFLYLYLYLHTPKTTQCLSRSLAPQSQHRTYIRRNREQFSENIPIFPIYKVENEVEPIFCESTENS